MLLYLLSIHHWMLHLDFLPQELKSVFWACSSSEVVRGFGSLANGLALQSGSEVGWPRMQLQAEPRCWTVDDSHLWELSLMRDGLLPKMLFISDITAALSFGTNWKRFQQTLDTLHFIDHFYIQSHVCLYGAGRLGVGNFGRRCLCDRNPWCTTVINVTANSGKHYFH